MSSVYVELNLLYTVDISSKFEFDVESSAWMSLTLIELQTSLPQTSNLQFMDCYDNQGRRKRGGGGGGAEGAVAPPKENLGGGAKRVFAPPPPMCPLIGKN